MKEKITLNAELWKDLKAWVRRRAPELENYTISDNPDDFIGL